MALPIVIAKNQTGTDIFLPRLGENVPALSQATLTDNNTFFEIAAEEQLQVDITSGDIVINDGVSDLNSLDALAYLDSTGNMNGPTTGTVNALVKLADLTGRYTAVTGVTVDASNNLSIPGNISASSVNVGGTPLVMDDLGDADTTTQVPTPQDRLRWDGSNWVPLKHNHTTTDPLVTDDSASTYEVGSRWVNTSTGTEYLCVGSAVGAAVWVETTQTADELSKVSANDTTAGYLLGKITTSTLGVAWAEVNDGGNEDLRLDVNTATTAGQGLIELATQAEVDAGTNTTLAVTPATLASVLTGSDLATVQVRDSAIKAVGLTYANITFDTTDIENDTSVLDHDNTNTDRINVSEDGLYMITFSCSFNADPGEEIIDLRVLKNDLTVLPGSERQVSEDDEINDISNVFFADLLGGDYITYQVQASGAGNTLIPQNTYTITRMQGIRGLPGIPGAGSTIIVQDEGVAAPNTPHSTFNFVGVGVTAVDAGAGVATITVPGYAPNIAQYRQSVNLTINTTATTVVLDATDFDDSNYTRTGSAINFNVAGIYKVLYQISFDTTSNSRRTISTWAELNAVEVVPSRAHAYARNNTDDNESAGATFFVQVALNDDLTIVAQSTGTNGTVLGLANQMWVSIEFVRGA